MLLTYIRFSYCGGLSRVEITEDWSDEAVARVSFIFSNQKRKVDKQIYDRIQYIEHIDGRTVFW